MPTDTERTGDRPGPVTDLGGTWRATPATDELRRRYQDYDFDDGDWATIAVPGQWQRHRGLVGAAGPVLHRHRFDLGWAPEGRRAWLVLDGVFYQSDVWLDGEYLGATEGYFFPHQFEVTEHLRRRREHCLAVEVACTPQRDRRRKRNLTGVFQDWDAVSPDLNPGGVWAPVRVVETGPVRILHHRALCGEATGSRARVDLRVVVHSSTETIARFRTHLAGVDHEADHRLATGENRLEWSVSVEDPVQWWPRALGRPALHELAVEVLVDGAPSDGFAHRIGFRSVELDDWVCRVNGERLFLKGTNLGPTDYWLSETDPDDVRRDLEHAAGAGLDLVRVHGHVAHPSLYDAADEAGLLVWQDLPLQWAYHRSVRPQAVRQAREAVDLLGHHPSVAIWCGHNAPAATDHVLRRGSGPARRALRYLVAQELPTWNRAVLDPSVARALRRADPTRPVVAHSGTLPALPTLEGGDTHLYLGWFVGETGDLARLGAAAPRLVRFVSEFGAQAWPADPDFVDPDDWPHLDWARLEADHGLELEAFQRVVPPAGHESLASWISATQRYQADLLRRSIEALRRLKYRPTGGFAQFFLADVAPGVTAAVLDHRRRPKLGYEALQAACRPVIVVADPLPPTTRPGRRHELDVHVVSDLRTPLEGARVVARTTWAGGESVEGWEGRIEADECTRVGRLELVVPDTTGPLAVLLELHAEGHRATNRYETDVVPDPEERPTP